MANTCFTDYTFVGEPEKAQKLLADMKRVLNTKRKDLGPDTYLSDSDWLGWIVRDLLGKEPLTVDQKIDILKQQVTTSVERLGEYRGILHVRRHLAATPIFKGIPNFRETRISILRAEHQDQLFQIIEDIRKILDFHETDIL